MKCWPQVGMASACVVYYPEGLRREGRKAKCSRGSSDPAQSPSLSFAECSGCPQACPLEESTSSLVVAHDSLQMSPELNSVLGLGWRQLWSTFLT